MPVLTKINTNVIADDAVTSAKIPADAIIASDLAPNITLTGDYVGIPAATTTERDALTAVVGMLIYNSTIGMLQQYNSQGWTSIDSPPTISSLDYPGDDTALDVVGEFALASSTTASGDATITVSSTTNLALGMLITGTGIPSSATVLSITDSTHFELSANATATGSANVTLTCNTQTLIITGSNFQSGATVTIDGTAPSTVTRNSSSQITVTGTPAKTAGTKLDGLVVTNVSGLGASINIDYSPLPGWSSPASGNLLNAFNGLITEIALTGGADTTSYAITTGALPTGLTIGSADGDINGTMNASAATYNFTVSAIDAQAQSSPRLFNIISRGALPTGGTITTYTGFRVHKFLLAGNGSATNIFTPSSSLNVDYLIVAGGGAGGGSRGAGGGAGGFLTATTLGVTAQTYTIVVGAGGTGANTQGADGVASTALGLSTVGGGGGGHSSTNAGRSGGSGGGAVDAAGLVGTGTAGPPRQGYNGGGGSGASAYGAGGGGGAGAAGGGGSSSGSGGTGGIGIHNSYLTGASGTTIATHYFAGGGSGGAYSIGGGSNAAINAYGGGRGRTDASGEDAIDNSGGGGGGGGYFSAGAGDGGDGGNGIVIIRYAV